MRRCLNLLLVIALMLALGTMAMAGKKGKMEKSLYDRLGGKTAISAVVDEFVARVAADKRINSFSHKQTSRTSRWSWWTRFVRERAVHANTLEKT